MSPRERFQDAKEKFLSLERERLEEQERVMQLNLEKRRSSHQQPGPQSPHSPQIVEPPISPAMLAGPRPRPRPRRPSWSRDDSDDEMLDASPAAHGRYYDDEDDVDFSGNAPPTGGRQRIIAAVNRRMSRESLEDDADDFAVPSPTRPSSSSRPGPPRHEYPAAYRGAEHPGRAGDHPGRGSDHTGRGSDHTGRGSDHPGRGGDHPSRAVDHTGRNGDHPGRGGDHPARAVDHSSRGGDHPSRGIDHPSRGVDHPSRGVDHPSRGVDHPNRSVDHPSRGVDHFSRGVDHPSRGVDHPSRGVDHPSRGVDHPSRGVDHPSRGVDHPSRGVDHPSRGVDHPSRGVDHPSRSVDHPSRGVDHPSRGGNHPSRGVDHPSRGGDPRAVSRSRSVHREDRFRSPARGGYPHAADPMSVPMAGPMPGPMADDGQHPRYRAPYNEDLDIPLERYRSSNNPHPRGGPPGGPPAPRHPAPYPHEDDLVDSLPHPHPRGDSRAYLADKKRRSVFEVLEDERRRHSNELAQEFKRRSYQELDERERYPGLDRDTARDPVPPGGPPGHPGHPPGPPRAQVSARYRHSYAEPPPRHHDLLHRANSAASPRVGIAAVHPY